jgi:hypothetical protein
MNIETFDNTVKKYTTFLDNEYVSAGLTIFLIVYASMAAPKLPNSIAKLFDNTFVKLLMFFMIVYISKRNATLAIVASIAVMVSLMSLNKLKIGKEMMTVVNNGNGKNGVHLKGCQCTCAFNADIDSYDNDEDIEIQSNLPRLSEESMSEESMSEEAYVTKRLAEESMSEEAYVTKRLAEESGRKFVSLQEESNRSGSEEALMSVAEHRAEEARVIAAITQEMPQPKAEVQQMAEEVKRRAAEITEQEGRQLTRNELRSLCSAVLGDMNVATSYDSKCASGTCGVNALNMGTGMRGISGFDGADLYGSAR